MADPGAHVGSLRYLLRYPFMRAVLCLLADLPLMVIQQELVGRFVPVLGLIYLGRYVHRLITPTYSPPAERASVCSGPPDDPYRAPSDNPDPTPTVLTKPRRI